MGFNLHGFLLSRAIIQRQGVPDERRARLLVIGGLSDFPAGLVLLETMVPRHASDSTGEVEASWTHICEALEEARDYSEDEARGELIAALEEVLRELQRGEN